MKRIVTVVALMITAFSASYAQCDKKIFIGASATEILNTDSTVQRTKLEHVELSYDGKNLAMSTSENPAITAVIEKVNCKWSAPFKDGQTVLKTKLSEDGNSHNVTFTIVGKAGKVYVYLDVEGKNKLARLVVDKFEDKKE